MQLPSKCLLMYAEWKGLLYSVSLFALKCKIYLTGMKSSAQFSYQTRRCFEVFDGMKFLILSGISCLAIDFVDLYLKRFVLV